MFKIICIVFILVSVVASARPEGLDKEQITDTIQKHIGEITSCYEQGVLTLPTLKGRILMKLVIGGSGKVTKSSIGETSLNNKGVEGCAVAKSKDWIFPKPVGGVDVNVSYPFVLQKSPVSSVR
jgi:hypothetical protein